MSRTFQQYAILVYRNADGSEAWRTRGLLADQTAELTRRENNTARRSATLPRLTVELILEATPEEQEAAWLASWTDAGVTARLHQRQAEVLLTVPEAARPAVYDEACIISNVCGGNLSGALWEAAEQWRRSGSFPYSDRNSAMLAREKAAKEATGRFVPEPFSRTWPEAVVLHRRNA